MPNITIIDSRGATHTIDAEPGITVMQAVVNNQIEGIVAECGGSCACGTCHCYVDEAWLAQMPPMEDIESATLECAIGVKPNSRLSCQIRLTEQMQGLRVALPETQI